MKLLFILIFVSSTFSFDIFERFMPFSGTVDTSLSINSTGNSTWNNLNVTGTLTGVNVNLNSGNIDGIAIGQTTPSNAIFGITTSTTAYITTMNAINANITTINATNVNATSITKAAFNTPTITLSQDTDFVLSGGVNGLSVDGTTLSVDGVNNRIGIGTSSPLELLTVKAKSTNTTALKVEQANDTQTAFSVSVDGSDNGQFGLFDASESTKVFIRSNGNSFFNGGNVGFGTAAPSYNIEAANGAVAGNGAYVNTSDKRLKEDNESVTGACDVLDNLEPLYYNWKSQVPVEYTTWAGGYDEEGNNLVDKQKHGQKDIGFFSQDVEPHFPQAVNVSDSGRYNLQYEKFIPLLVACIKEMRR